MRFFLAIILLVVGPCYGLAQDSTVNLSASMFNKNQAIRLFTLDAWIFRQGNDSTWARIEVDRRHWQKINPGQVAEKLAGNKRMEGWFRIRIKPDSSFGNMPLYLGVFGWTPTDVYVDGNFFHSYGNTGIYGQPFKESHQWSTIPMSPVHLTPGEHLVAIHFVTFSPPFPLSLIRGNESVNPIPLLSGPALIRNMFDYHKVSNIYFTICVAICGALSLLFWLLVLQNRHEKNLALIALCSSCFSLSALLMSFVRVPGDISRDTYLLISMIEPLFTGMMVLLIPVILAKVFTTRVPRRLVVFSMIWMIFSYYTRLTQNSLLIFISVVILISIATYYVISSWKNLKGAQWAIVSGVLFTLFWSVLWVFALFSEPSYSISYSIIIPALGTYLSFPISLLGYISIRFREIIAEVQENARRVMQVMEEKKQQALNQQQILQEEVKKQTAELRDTLEDLRSTQSQLIHSEKMASLGELTAGIAHEIQNPVNFINNFSELNKELIAELQDEQKKEPRNFNIENEILTDINMNLERVITHGKRADAIVKGMLQHSKGGAGKKEPTDLNDLAAEYLKLSYHGFRAKDKSFNATIKTHFDENIGTIDIVPADIGKVLINLFNNAFYAILEKKKLQPGIYEPSVIITTKKYGGKIEISVKDTGNGIPGNVLGKIFQPFFTTKPAGQGTGLGLSLSYDIVKAQGGEIKVFSKDGEGSEFIVVLPVKGD